MSETLEVVRPPSPMLKLSRIVEESPELFAVGSDELRNAALDATKFVFDLAVNSESVSRPFVADFLSSLSPLKAPQTRSQTRNNAKQIKSPEPVAKFEETPIASLFVEAMEEEQIWEQLDLRSRNIYLMLEEALQGERDEGSDSDEDEESSKLHSILPGLAEKGVDIRELLNGMDVDDRSDSEEDQDLAESESEDDEYGHLNEGEREGEGGGSEGQNESEDGESEGEGEEDLDPQEAEDGEFEELNAHEDGEGLDRSHPSDGEGVDRSLGSFLDQPRPTSQQNRGAKHKLDDGFFDLATFNAEIEEAEAKNVTRGRLGTSIADEDSEDDNLSVDLFAPVEDVGMADEADIENDMEDPMYNDFFEPPPRNSLPKQNKPTPAAGPSKNPGLVRFHDQVVVKKFSSQSKKRPASILDNDEEVESLEMLIRDSSNDDGEDGADFALQNGADGPRATIDRSKHDLFAQDEDPSTDQSTHEKRQAALKEQIKTLEAENVSQKDWTLLGEANSRARPQNSLLEEDLEFERVMKATPVITEETVQALEERIKARILEGRFDDVVRVRPLDDKPFLPSRFFELKDTKSTQSLAQIYEEEYTATQTGGIAGEDRDGKLKKEQDEIQKQWEAICGKLDALCNAHFVPKQPKASISTITNMSTATLESALPTAMSASSILAPEEVYAPSSSNLRAKNELTPAEKRALRTKERKSKKKMRQTLEIRVDKYARAKGIGGVKKEKRTALESVIKTGKGVTVVGKKVKEVVQRGKHKHS